MTSSGIPIEGDDVVDDSTMTEREAYFEWLCTCVDVPEDKDYTTLFEIMHLKEFVWVIGNDDNRIQDGRDLRILYASERYGESEARIIKMRDIYDDPVSTFEVLIGLSERLGFLIDVAGPVCAQMLIQNLELDKYRNDIHRIEDVLDRLIWRTYKPNGVGGFFPLRHASRDQTKVEIWYQMAKWIEENYPLYDI